MKNEMFWDQDPDLPEEVNDCIDLMLLVFEWPPSFRTEVRRTTAGWRADQLEDVCAYASAEHANASDNHNAVPAEPEHLFDLRRRLALVFKREAVQRRPAREPTTEELRE